jgi:hypothetical protein
LHLCLHPGPTLDIFDHLGEQEGLDFLTGVAALTVEEESELAEIPAKLRDLTSSNPAALAAQARQRASQLRALAHDVEIVANKLGNSNVELSEKLRNDVEFAQVEVEQARLVFDDADTLSGTGNDVWQRMWLAAKEFADSGTQDRDFPNDVATCPLCAQLLDSVARTRFELFAEFMSGEAQTKLATARALREADVEALIALPFASLVTQEMVDLVETYDEGVAAALLPRTAEAERLRDSLVTSTPDSGAESFDHEGLNSALTDIVKKLRTAANAEENNANALATTDESALAVVKLTAKRDELMARKRIVAERDQIGAQHDRTIVIARLNDAKSACSTTGASRKNSELSQDYVDKVCHQFEIEAKMLGLSRVPVELVFDRSSQGVSYLKVRLKDAPQIPVASVLSEGEQRVTAIAGFFADLTESGDTSSLVFDDPVSSLDQEYRVKVAQRLLQEAESRQVMVFTHDFAFVQYLYEEKDLGDLRKAAVGLPAASDLHYLHITRSQSGAGVPTEAEVWRHVSVKERLGRLRARYQSAAVVFRTGDMATYEKEARDIVGAIRETWEVFVEQDLLYGVVKRHERSVQTMRLAKLTDLTDQGVAVVELGMTIESRHMTGHAAPTTDGSAPQDPDWLIAEIESLATFRKAVISRRN